MTILTQLKRGPKGLRRPCHSGQSATGSSPVRSPFVPRLADGFAMAGDWIPMRLDLDRDPRVIQIAAALGLSDSHVVGLLHRFWSWASEQTIDGNAPAVTETWIDCYIGVTGFCAAVKNVGWIESDNPGGVGITIHNFARHMSETAKSRAKTRMRVARHRGKCNADAVTKSLPQNRTEQNRTEDEKKKRTAPAAELPDVLNTDKFRDIWADWMKHRAEIGHTLKPTTIKSQLKKLEKMGHDEAIAQLRQSIEQGYQGLFPVRGDGRPGKGAARFPSAGHNEGIIPKRIN